MNGKNKCRILKEIRRQIVEQNDIAYVTSECKHKGDCLGTCPKCESEVRYLEKELEKRRKAGYTVALAGLAAALTVSASGCSSIDLTDPSSWLGRTKGEMILYDGDIRVLPAVGDLFAYPMRSGIRISLNSIGPILPMHGATF